MSEFELDATTVQVATQVIIHAGNARTLVQQALDCAHDGEFDLADEKLKRAREEIRAAHTTQTEMIQAEARGESLPYSLLLTHAQDTLMIAMSEAQMAKHMLKLYGQLKQLAGENK